MYTVSETSVRRPTFLESLGREYMLDNKINNAIDRSLPSALQKSAGKISEFVKLHLPGILNQQHYFQEAIQEQAKNFKETIQEQAKNYEYTNKKQKKMFDNTLAYQKSLLDSTMTSQKEYFEQQNSNMMNDLDDKVDTLVSESIYDLTSQNNVVNKMEQQIAHNVKTDLDEHFSSQIWKTSTLSGIVGTIIGFILCYYVLMFHVISEWN